MCVFCKRVCEYTTCLPLRGQKRESDPLEGELRKVLSHHGVLGAVSGSSGRAAGALTH